MASEATDNDTLAELETALPTLRPELHRYCARMTGSVIDGEDVVQEALLRAARALQSGSAVDTLRPWLFRIAHNAAMDHFNRRTSELAMHETIGSENSPSESRPEQGEVRGEIRDGLRLFLDLPPKQRSTVILRDVLGHSAREVAELIGDTVEAVKSSLHRGRRKLREKNAEEEAILPPLTAGQREQLAAYTRHFNAHDFDRLRDMLASEVRLDLVAKHKSAGRTDVGNYFSNYERQSDWVLVPGRVEGRPAILVFEPDNPEAPPVYFVLVEFRDGQIRKIRDFRYARYVMADAVWIVEADRLT